MCCLTDEEMQAFYTLGWLEDDEDEENEEDEHDD